MDTVETFKQWFAKNKDNKNKENSSNNKMDNGDLKSKIINILGTEYEVLRQTKNENPKLETQCGYCDFSVKKIVIDTFEQAKEDVNAQEDLGVFFNKVLRHEIIHAFLGESGLRGCSDWAEIEEMVDWLAIQFPKIQKVFEELKITE